MVVGSRVTTTLTPGVGGVCRGMYLCGYYCRGIPDQLASTAFGDLVRVMSAFLRFCLPTSGELPCITPRESAFCSLRLNS